MTKELLIHIKEVSSAGHDEWDIDPKEAVDFLNKKCSNGKWLFIDGEFISPEEICLDDLVEASDIVLTNELVGGQN